MIELGFTATGEQLSKLNIVISSYDSKSLPHHRPACQTKFGLI
jgi:hypothetical protein